MNENVIPCTLVIRSDGAMRIDRNEIGFSSLDDAEPAYKIVGIKPADAWDELENPAQPAT